MPEPPELVDAARFIDAAEEKMEMLQIPATRADWIYKNFITTDTETTRAAFGARYQTGLLHLGQRTAALDANPADAESRRKLTLFKHLLSMPPPDDPELAQELSQVSTRIASLYNTGEYCPPGGKCLDLNQMSRRFATSRDAGELQDLWSGWREITPPMKPMYERQVKLANQGALALGYGDVSELWRSKYDMPAAEFSAEIDHLWQQVKPLYDALHCHVRARLGDHYGEELVPPAAPIPAHLMGNMWAQSWENIYDLVAPAETTAAVDVTRVLRERDVDEVAMVRIAEGFFTSLGMQSLPETFYERSLFLQPADRQVACHASAHNIDQAEDVRIKMCMQRTGDDFTTVHHELGHIYYYLSYNHQPWTFRFSAHDGFHEAVGDTLALSVTPGYLQQIGLIEAVPDTGDDLGELMKMALTKVAFLPFSLMMDQWRWQVLSGSVPMQDYNRLWWQLREKYQGVAAPVARRDDHFDPGAKYHIADNTPYMRYFMAHILQFQFHEALCEIAGQQGPLSRCSIYGSRAAGERLQAMLAMGRSKPWPDALEALTGTRRMDGEALIRYFAPLQAWLDQENRGRQCGW